MRKLSIDVTVTLLDFLAEHSEADILEEMIDLEPDATRRDVYQRIADWCVHNVPPDIMRRAYRDNEPIVL